jgi:hypothetical protein
MRSWSRGVTRRREGGGGDLVRRRRGATACVCACVRQAAAWVGGRLAVGTRRRLGARVFNVGLGWLVSISGLTLYYGFRVLAKNPRVKI